MPRWSKWLLGALALLALLLVGGYVTLQQLLPAERLATLLAQQVAQRTGRSLRIDGKLNYRLLPRISVVAEGLALANAPWGSRPDMLKVENAELDLRLWPLLHGEMQIDKVALQGLDLLLETNREGVGNWNLPALTTASSGSAQAPAAQRPAFELARLHLAKAHVVYRDGRSGTTQALDLPALDLVRRGDALDLAGDWTLAGQRWQVKGQLGPLPQLIANRADWPFELQLRSDGAQAAAQGVVVPGAPRAVRTTLSASLSKAAALAPWLPTMPPLPIELKTTLRASTQSIIAEPLHLSVAGQALDGRLSARRGTPWQIDASLHAKTMALPQAQSAAGVGSSTPSERRWLFGDTPQIIDSLPSLQATLQLHIDQLSVPQLPPLTGFIAKLSLHPDSLRLAPLSFTIAGGHVQADARLSPRPGAPPRVELQVEAAGLSAQTLTRAAAAGSRFSGGSLQANAQLRMSGRTPRELAAGADGTLLLAVRDMRIDAGAAAGALELLPRLLGAVSPQRGAARSTLVECAVARLPLENGVARVDRSIAVETPELAISASGQIDLRDETLELAFRPSAKGAAGIDAARLASLIVAKGPLLAPKLTLDAQGAAEMALSIGAAAAAGKLSALGQQLLHQSGDAHPCQTALSGKSSAAPAAAAAPNRQAPAAEPALTDLLRKLFKK